MLKNHSCGELRDKHVGKEVTLAGWVHRRRDHGGLIFIDLRDKEGIAQVVFNPEMSKEAHKTANELRNEYVAKITGKVAKRPAGTENLKLPTGKIEVVASDIQILNTAKTPPFYINEDIEVDENLYLKYRYLYLRRPRVKDNIILRHRVEKFMRDFLDTKGFVEIETPILIKSTPEGARDYLVPSRIHPGKFYALPQSPQQLKQLLMVAGFEKYYQIARCFRDEDLRADRQPEFTQLDMEMSFIDEEDILSLLEEMFTSMVETIKPEMKMLKPFPRLSFAETMERFGTDKPDIRFGLELKDLSAIVAESEFAVFRSTIQGGGKVRGICLPGCADYSHKQLEDLTELAKSCGARGLVTMALSADSFDKPEQLTPDKVKSVAAKYLTAEQLKDIVRRFEAKLGDLILIVAGEPKMVNKVLDELRREMGRRLGLIDPNHLVFFFVVDFPLLDWNEETKLWEPIHHPFTSPREEDIPLLDKDPAKVRARHYDIVCNGYELSSGSIRIHTRELQQNIFRLLGYSDEDIEAKFGHMLEAFDYGAPPHGGIAPGIDRVVMLLAGAENIREVIAFPKNQSAMDVMSDSPSPVSEAQLKELHLKLTDEEIKKA
ncbi:MAG: aspartate--tRNA ligase [Dehalococcoidia bacterium]|nr:aspartate--tRNA ligase [Dehalococcoidia bacterium]